MTVSDYSLSFLSISSHLLTSLTNLRWNTFTSGFSCQMENMKKKKTAIYHSLYCLAKPFDKAHVSCTYISKLDHTQFPQLTDAAVRCLRLEEELGQGHLLTSEQLPHDDHWITTFTRVKQTCNDAIKYFGEVYFIMALLLCTLTKYSAVGRHIPREDHTHIRHV